MDTNPYQSPQTDCHAPENWRDSALRVDGRHLVVPAGTVLPPVCVKTNQPVSQADMVRASLFWCSPWVAIAALGGLLVIPALFLLGKRFTITYGLVPELRRRYRTLRIVKMAAVVSGSVTLLFACAVFVGMFVFFPSVVLDIGPGVIVKPLMIANVVGFSLLFVAILSGIRPLTVRKHRQGVFWVKGCSEEYLARLEAETVPGDFPAGEAAANG